MKTLGLIGGVSWESTTHYYQLINRMVRERRGGQASAELLLHSFNFAPIAELQAKGEWDRLTDIMIGVAQKLEAAGAEGLMICANTMHKMAPQVAAAISIPLIHIADATAASIKQVNVVRPILFATRFTMEQDFIRDRLKINGVEALVPDAQDRATLHAIIYEELVQGVFREESRQILFDMFAREQAANGADGVILGCTEFGMLAPPHLWTSPAFDTAELHTRAAVDFALG